MVNTSEDVSKLASKESGKLILVESGQTAQEPERFGILHQRGSPAHGQTCTPIYVGCDIGIEDWQHLPVQQNDSSPRWLVDSPYGIRRKADDLVCHAARIGWVKLDHRIFRLTCPWPQNAPHKNRLSACRVDSIVVTDPARKSTIRICVQDANQGRSLEGIGSTTCGDPI
ncbi:hypothetical protein CBM2604_P60009 [Cupriavidus taiwanensis]|nr:hypothetical protein CBM2604_P60009 [Cupriavidus taiwanensis]SOZ52466.1 hypothetical protein CBM2610_P60009 [Cupriavidus taiwanensis]